MRPNMSQLWKITKRDNAQCLASIIMEGLVLLPLSYKPG